VYCITLVRLMPAQCAIEISRLLKEEKIALPARPSYRLDKSLRIACPANQIGVRSFRRNPYKKFVRQTRKELTSVIAFELASRNLVLPSANELVEDVGCDLLNRRSAAAGKVRMEPGIAAPRADRRLGVDPSFA
jgi:hypothetical protein